ncbi:hypothetical protein S245_064803, partial [Arachis hypogaea]
CFIGVGFKNSRPLQFSGDFGDTLERSGYLLFLSLIHHRLCTSPKFLRSASSSASSAPSALPDQRSDTSILHHARRIAFNLKWFEANKTESIGVDVVGVLTLANACKDHSLPMPIKTKRVTRVELNKRLRHKEQQKKAAEAKKLEDLSKEID